MTKVLNKTHVRIPIRTVPVPAYFAYSKIATAQAEANKSARVYTEPVFTTNKRKACEH